MGEFTGPAKQIAVPSIHSIDNFAKRRSFEEILIFIAKKIAQDVTSLKIHAAQRDVTVWEKNITMFSFVRTR
ncbi:hypothetical protein AOQ71_06660 [Bradyrhizobium manausense]|uniref:Uncharacterized protein n=1 Tax=Bradyrhizobium manausense TaxID=989370 RepID=A0A0R3EAG2_9BRAD|nr:hypothetical protein AOQ71_06660 [Bradyrhizobium manausense]